MPKAAKIGETSGRRDINWSESSSLVSNSETSSPNAGFEIPIYRPLNEPFTSCSNDGVGYRGDNLAEASKAGNLASIFPQAPGLDQDLGSVGILLENCGGVDESHQLDFNDLYTASEAKPTVSDLTTLFPQQAGGYDSGELTPVSNNSEFEYQQHQDCEVNLQSDMSKNCSAFSESDTVHSSSCSGLKDSDIDVRFDENKAAVVGGAGGGGGGEEEEEEGEKTITTINLAPRESIIGFFSESQGERKFHEGKDIGQ